VKEDEMGKACSLKCGEQQCIEEKGRVARRKETDRKT
jgi:hypothetical protein